MPNGGSGRMYCKICGYEFDIINIGWWKPGQPAVTYHGSRYAGRWNNQGELICFDCVPASRSEIIRWKNDGWKLGKPPFV